METSQIRSQTDAILFSHKGGDTFGTTSAKDTGSNCHYEDKTQIQPVPILTIAIQQSVGIHAIYSLFPMILAAVGCSQTSNGLSAMAHNGPVRARDGAGFGVDDRVGDTIDVEVTAIYQGAGSKVLAYDLNLGDSGVAFISANGSMGSSASEVSLPLLKYPATEDPAEAIVPNAGGLSSPADCQAQCTELMLVASTVAQLDRTTSHPSANSQPFLRLVEAAEHPDSLSYRSKMTAAQLEVTGLPICRHYPAHFAEVEGHNCPVFKLRKMIEVGVSGCEGKWCSLGSAESSSAWYSQKRELGNGLFGLVDLYEREELGDDSDFQRNWL
ncbi:hypothetical protein BDQ17DRAFT_1366973 [Cyathus striatus]|nr:hypothetical protein BDQ17DRAFT_1366973 [Cyathus striatus]